MNNFLEKDGYYGSVEFSAEDECFYGKLLGINDLISFEGESVKELKKSFSEAIFDYYELCKRVGKAPEKIYKGSFNVRINPEVHKKAAIVAGSEHISLNKFVEKALIQQLQSINFSANHN